MVFAATRGHVKFVSYLLTHGWELELKTVECQCITIIKSMHLDSERKTEEPLAYCFFSFKILFCSCLCAVYFSTVLNVIHYAS